MKNIVLTFITTLICMTLGSQLRAEPTTGTGGNPPYLKQLEALAKLNEILAKYPVDGNGFIVVPDKTWTDLVPALEIDWTKIDLVKYPGFKIPEWKPEGLLSTDVASAIEVLNTQQEVPGPSVWVVSEAHEYDLPDLKDALDKLQYQRETLGTDPNQFGVESKFMPSSLTSGLIDAQKSLAGLKSTSFKPGADTTSTTTTYRYTAGAGY